MWKSATLVLGLVLLAVGGWLQYAKPEVQRVRELVKIGSFSATVKQDEPVPPWVSIVCLGGGVVLLGVGIASRS